LFPEVDNTIMDVDEDVNVDAVVIEEGRSELQQQEEQNQEEEKKENVLNASASTSTINEEEGMAMRAYERAEEDVNRSTNERNSLADVVLMCNVEVAALNIRLSKFNPYLAPQDQLAKATERINEEVERHESVRNVTEGSKEAARVVVLNKMLGDVSAELEKAEAKLEKAKLELEKAEAKLEKAKLELKEATKLRVKAQVLNPRKRPLVISAADIAEALFKKKAWKSKELGPFHATNKFANLEESVKLLQTPNNGPSLLLYRLGDKNFVEMSDDEFKYLVNKKRKLLFAPSGAGKTRKLFELLCREFGYYLIHLSDKDKNYGSQALQRVLLELEFESTNWSKDSNAFLHLTISFTRRFPQKIKNLHLKSG
jgi:hypothetical protein